MTKKELKTLDVEAFEHFDKANGNSYFSARLTLNSGLENEETHLIPFQYGYGSQFETEAANVLRKLFPRTKWAKRKQPLWMLRYDRVKVNTSKVEGLSERKCKALVSA